MIKYNIVSRFQLILNIEKYGVCAVFNNNINAIVLKLK